MLELRDEEKEESPNYSMGDYYLSTIEVLSFSGDRWHELRISPEDTNYTGVFKSPGLLQLNEQTLLIFAGPVFQTERSFCYHIDLLKESVVFCKETLSFAP